jgi:hypothetical protein
MRYIKTYEKFNLNETLDMFTMPVDPIKGMADVYGDIWNSMKDYATKGVDFLEDVLDKIKDIFYELVDKLKIPFEKLIENIEKYFGSPAHDLTFRKIVEVLMRKNPASTLVKESRESEMEAHTDFETTKDIGQKALSILQAIFGINVVGGVAVMFINWIQSLLTGFSLWDWAQTQPWIQDSNWLDAATNPGSRGFMIVWAVISIVAIVILGFIKKVDAWIVTSDTYKKNFQ